jgi:hypothetical protein
MTKRSVTSFPKGLQGVTSFLETGLIKAHFVRRIYSHKTNQKINLAVVGWKSQQQKVSLVSIFHNQSRQSRFFH